MDPLSVLRDYAMRGELDSITRSGDELRFGSEYVFPCSTVTGYRSKQGGFYSLETLLFFIRNHHLKHTDYLQATRPIRLPAVTFPDRKPLLDYLLGRSASSDYLVPLPPFSGDPAFAAPGASGDEYHPSDEPLEVPSADDGGSRVPDRDAEEIVSYIARIRELERPLRDREAMLECRNRDFHAVLLASTRREEERQRLESHQRKDGLVAKMRVSGSDDHHHRAVGAGDDASDAMSKAKLHLKGGKIGEGVPIILVPSASQTLITIHNVKEFLEDGVFVPMDAKVKAARGPKPDCVTVQKKLSRDRAVTAYEVRDKTSSFKADEWDRVVAVFVLGKEWQFKDWPFKDHIEIFNKVIGFYVRFEDDSLESAKMVKQWNVKIIAISKNKRHQDRAAALEVWEKLEQFMRSRAHQ